MTLPTKMPREAGGTFLSCMAEGGFHQSATARSRSADGVTTMAFFGREVSPLMVSSGRPGGEHRGGLGGAGQNDAVDVFMVINARPTSRLAG
ncbi:hypothetical protein [Corynebacterium glutamicum]|uniref:hypothetical protein n=1 Tax=Corynebacterium glutamicum TaxID=1718 RepID=UPI0020B89CFD|nr:hypothetical protein [Corynebacterium glutamicum]